METKTTVNDIRNEYFLRGKMQELIGEIVIENGRVGFAPLRFENNASPFSDGCTRENREVPMSDCAASGVAVMTVGTDGESELIAECHEVNTNIPILVRISELGYMNTLKLLWRVLGACIVEPNRK